MSITGKGSLARRVAAAAGALALGFAGLAGAALTANATGDPTGVGNIVAGKATSLTIHKYSGLEALTNDNGLPKDIDTSTHKPLNGVQFKITPVTEKGGQTINLDKPEGWDLIKGVTVDQVKAGDFKLAADPAATVETATVDGVDGVAKADLPHGLYLVQEGDDNGNNDIVSKTADFLVTLPLPQVGENGATDGTWIYDVNVYPKNQILIGPSKTIKPVNPTDGQSGLKIGDKVQYTIDQVVPALNAGEKYTSASIFDYLDPAELQFVDTVSVQVGAKDAEGKFTGSDIAYTYDAANATWNLTATKPGVNPGDPNYINLTADQVVRVVFTAKVLKVTESGVVDNKPWTTNPGEPGYGSEFNGKKVPGTTTPHSYWGQLQVLKVDEGGHNLADAHFSVYENGCPADGSQPTSDAVATGTSDDSGIVQWNSTPANPLGLFVANSDTDQDAATLHKNYCLYETKAPAGYIKDYHATVTIKPGTKLVKDVNNLTVTNVQQKHPNLPLTGAAGTVVMTLGGLALVAAGGAAYAISRKRSAR